MAYNTVPSDEVINKTVESLMQNGFVVHVASNKEEAKKLAFSLFPSQSEVMHMTSKTLEEVGILEGLQELNAYNLVKEKLSKLDRATQRKEMNAMGATPDIAIGSAQAVTQDGKLMFASATGSQLPAYAFGSPKVIIVVGVNKLVKDMNDGLTRIYDYALPLESVRVQKAYGMERSSVNKLLILNKEPEQNRTHVIIVKEVLGQ